MRKRMLRWLAGGLTVILLLSSCGNGSEISQTADGGKGTAGAEGTEGGAATSKERLIVASSTDPGTMNPYDSGDMFTRRLSHSVLEQLFRADEDLEMVPELVESYEFAEDNLSVTLHLRKNVLFHNGEEMKAEDVLYSFDCMRNGPNASALSYLDWDNIRAEDDYTVVVPTQYVVGPLLAGLSEIVVVNKKAMEEAGSQAGLGMVGTGPFCYSEWVSGDHLTLTRFADYWGEKPALSEIIFRFISEPSVAMIELETGGVDLVLDPQGTDVQKLMEEGEAAGYGLYVGTGVFNNYIGFNCSKAPFDDLKVRQAVAHAIDREAIVAAAYEGIGWPANSIVSSGAWGYNPDVPDYSYDPEQAKSMLAEAGYGDGMTISLCIDDKATRVATAEQLVNMLAAVGITLQVQSYDFSTYSDLISNTNDYDCYLRGVVFGADPGSQLIYNGASDGHLGGMNAAKTEGIPEAEEFDRLVNQALATTDDDERKKLYQEAQTVFMENVFQFHIQTNPEVAVYVPELKGYWKAGAQDYLPGIYFE